MLEYLNGDLQRPKGSILLFSSYAHPDPQEERGTPILVASAVRGKVGEILHYTDHELFGRFKQKNPANDLAIWPVFSDEGEVTYNLPSFASHTKKEIPHDKKIVSLCDIVKISPIIIPNSVSKIFESALTLYMNTFVQSRYKIFIERSKRHYAKEPIETREEFILAQIEELTEARKQGIDEWMRDTMLTIRAYLKKNALNTLLDNVITEEDPVRATLRTEMLIAVVTERYEKAVELRDRLGIKKKEKNGKIITISNA